MHAVFKQGRRAMANDESIGDIQERIRGAGLLLLDLSENTDAVANLRGSIDNDDLRHFRSTLFNAVGDLPPDKCNPYVQVIITILKPPKFVRRCEWVPRLVDPDEGEQIAAAVRNGIDEE